MKNNVICLVAAAICLSTSCFAEFPEADLKYVGYSDDIISAVNDEFGLSNYADVFSTDQNELSEVDSTVEQLKELAVSRSITADNVDRSAALKKKNADFWNKINTKSQETEKVVVSEETKATIKANIEKVLTENGYKIIQLSILPVSESSTKNAVRAIVRVAKPMKTGGYNEVQSRLNSIKDLCVKAATFDGNCWLSEMTTFVAENPKNKFYYEKTILR